MDFQDSFISQNWNFVPISPSLQPLASSIPFSIPMNLTALDSSDQWNHTAFATGLFYLALCLWGSFMLWQLSELQSFLRLNSIPLHVCRCDVLFVHSSTDGLPGCFHLLVIVSTAAMNISVLNFFLLEVQPLVVLLGNCLGLNSFFLPFFIEV